VHSVLGLLLSPFGGGRCAEKRSIGCRHGTALVICLKTPDSCGSSGICRFDGQLKQAHTGLRGDHCNEA
jgi:hypothetical protein